MRADQLRRLLIGAAGSNTPRVPEAGQMIWAWFVALSDARTSNMAGPNPIAFSEIEAYSRLRRLPIEPRHVDLIRAMDLAYLDAAYSKGASDKPTVPRGTQKLTVAAFDAVFG